MMLLCDNVVISDNITLILSAWPEFLWRHMRQSVPVWSRILFIWRGNNLNIPCLPDPGKFRGMNTKLILYTKSFILNVVKESRVARQARHSVSFLRSLVTMAVTRPRFCPPLSSIVDGGDKCSQCPHSQWLQPCQGQCQVEQVSNNGASSNK